MDVLKFLSKEVSIQSALFFANGMLYGFDNIQLEAELLLSYALKKDRVYLKKNPQIFLSLAQQVRFLHAVLKRKRGFPLAYITGRAQWMDLDLFVNNDVLIPRDETEILFEHIKAFPRQMWPRKILDMGTGSGCLAIACAKHFNLSGVWAIDNSSGALKVARKNAHAHKLQVIHFKKSDLFSKVKEETEFDMIVANLPYVPIETEVTDEVKREPASAIFSGKDGLDHIREFAKQLASKKIIWKEVWLEFLPEQQEKIREIFSPHKVEFKTDIGGDVFFAVVSPGYKLDRYHI